MKLRIISWNVRGANENVNRKLSKYMIKMQKANLVCLQEKNNSRDVEGDY